MAVSSAIRMGLCNGDTTTAVPTRILCGAGGNMGRQDQGGGRHAVPRKMVLRQPGPVKSQFLSVLHLLRRLRNDLGQVSAFWPGHMGKKGEFHMFLLS